MPEKDSFFRTFFRLFKREDKTSKVLKYFFLLFFGFFLGFFLKSVLVTRKGVTLNREIRLPENYRFINPLLECDSNLDSAISTKNLVLSLEDYIKTQKKEKIVTEVAVYYRDLNNGPWFGINENILFSPASLVKVPLLMTYFKDAESNPEILKRKIKNTFKSTDYPRVYFSPKEKLEFGVEYSVEELIRRMIVYSDNVAHDLLFNNIDNEKLKKTYGDLGVDTSKIYEDPGGNSVSIKDYSSFFRILYNSSYLNRDLSEKALRILSETVFTDGIVAGAPKDIIVSHKFGERNFVLTGEKQLHDCGIVYKPQKTYMVCIMTKGNDLVELAKVIKEISSMIYSFISQE